MNHLYDNKVRNLKIPSHNNPEKKPSLMHIKKKHIMTLLGFLSCTNESNANYYIITSFREYLVNLDINHSSFFKINMWIESAH
jgi:hypothetical protein